MSICIYVDIVDMYICIYVDIVDVYICIYVAIVDMCICIYVDIVDMYMYMYMFMYVYLYMHICVYDVKVYTFIILYSRFIPLHTILYICTCITYNYPLYSNPLIAPMLQLWGMQASMHAFASA